MEEKNCVASFYIKLSSNATAIPLTECELLNLVRTFRYFDRNKAADVLFRFKYGTTENKKTALNWFIQQKSEYFSTDPESLSFVKKIKEFTNEQFVFLANELQIQYQASYPDFLNINSIKGLPDGCQKELDTLQEKMSNSLLLFFLVVKKCVSAKKNPSVSKWIVQLLSSNPASQCEGLKNIGLNFNCRLLAKQFSNEIGMLLLSMHQIYVKRQKLLDTTDILALPLVTLLKEMVELDIKNIALSKQNDSNGQYYHSNVVAYFERNVFKFIEISTQNFGYDFLTEYSGYLAHVGEKIINLLKCQLGYKEVFNEYENSGILFVYATNYQVHNKMALVQENLSKAKEAYYEALTTFQVFYYKYIEVN